MNAPEMKGLCGLDFKMPIDVYHAHPSISKSGLDLLNRSPAIFHAWQSPDAPERLPKPGQLEGNLAHCAVLEPAEFSKRYAIGPSVNRNTKAWKEFVEGLAPDMVAIQQDQADAAWRQAKSVRKLPEIREVLERGHAETSAFWIDPQTGVQCRCRPDFAHPCGDSGVILLDLKTYSDASPDEFRRQAARKRYEVQDAFYSDGYAAASGLDVLAFIFVAVETEWPYAASAVMLDDISKDSGRVKYRRDLDLYAACMASGEWPGYSNQIEIVTLPAWAL